MTSTHSAHMWRNRAASVLRSTLANRCVIEFPALKVSINGGDMAITNPLIPSEATTGDTGDQDDFDFGDAGLLRCDNASLLTLRGLRTGRPGQLLTIVSTGSGQVDVSNEDNNSSASNRTVNGVTGPISLAQGSGRVTLRYDGTSERWRVVEHEQGAWITPSFSAGDFTANSGMTWTVDAGDVQVRRCMLRGRTLTYQFLINSTSVSGTPNTELRVGIPHYTPTATQRNACSISDRGTGHVRVMKVPSANWSASTNNTFVWCLAVSK